MPYAAGDILFADDLGGLNDAWTSFTPTIAGSGSPTVGNGTVVGRYMRVGNTVDVVIQFVRGSTSDFGTANFTWDFPVGVPTARVTDFAAASAWFYDASAGAGFAGSALFEGTDSLRPIASSGNVTDTVPFTWAASDVMVISIRYETS